MHRQRFVVSMQWLIGVVIAAVMTVMAVALLWFSWHQSQRTLGATLEETSHQLVSTLEAHTQALVRPSQVAIDMLASGATGSASDWLEQRPLMASALAAHRLIDAVYMANGDGDFVMFRSVERMMESVRPELAHHPDAAYLALVVPGDASAADASEWRLYDQRLSPLGREPLAQYFFDPRTRPWFQRASREGTSYLTAPYAFYYTGEIGISMARRHGEVVVGLDVASQDLGLGMDSLRLTPGTRMAIVTDTGQALATTIHSAEDDTLSASASTPVSNPASNPANSSSSASTTSSSPLNATPGIAPLDQPGSSRAVTDGRLASIDELNFPVLRKLRALEHTREHLPSGEQSPVRLEHEGRHWWGLVLPFARLGDQPTQLLAVVPEEELSAGAGQMIIESSVLAGMVTLALLPLGLVLGRRLGRPLQRLSEQVEALGRYDFAGCHGVSSRVSEVRGLSLALGRLSRGVEGFGRITRVLNSEPQLAPMLTSILEDLLQGAGSRSGAIYLADEHNERRFERVAQSGEARDPDSDPRAPELVLEGSPEGALARLEADFDRHDYLLQPLCNREGAILGLLAVALRSTDDDDLHWRAFVKEVSSAAAVAIDLRRLLQGEARLLDGIVKLVARAIDAKSPHTGSHCSRVPALAELIVNAIERADSGAFAEVHFDQRQRSAFHLAAWLHDCGKLAIPDEVMEKATKLEARHDRIHEIRTRFDVLWRDADVAYWQGRAHGGDPVILERRRHARQQELTAAFECVAEANRGGEAISDALLEQLATIAEWRWWRHFDDRLGLSRDELARMAREPVRRLPAEERLLADLPRHEIPWHRSRPAVERGDPDNRWQFDMSPCPLAGHHGELYNLSVRRGTLNDVERFRIQEHVIQTIMMLEALPWPAHLRQVPSIAGNHHERMDGTGYPRRLKLKEASLEEKVMVMADVFEALTAADRPYKAAMTLSRALALLADMVRDGHLDPDLYRLLLEQRVYRDFAKRFLKPGQWDKVDPQALLARAGLEGDAAD